MSRPSTAQTAHTTAPLASSAGVRVGTAWKVSRSVPQLKSAVAASTASTSATVRPVLVAS